ncbi:unnamed protein product [Closterium sp. NIES-65]|nr:unnamed protein product [Closterium sp. NIES-65]
MYTQYKLLDLVEGKEKMPEVAEQKGAWMKRSFYAYMLMVQAVGGRQLDHIKDLLAINLNSQQPQWSVNYIRARILEEDLQRRSVERLEEGAGYGVEGGKSGFKMKWRCASTASSADIIGGIATNDPRIGPRLHQATSVVARGVGESWELVEGRRRRRKAANLRSGRSGSSSS